MIIVSPLLSGARTTGEWGCPGMRGCKMYKDQAGRGIKFQWRGLAAYL